MGKTRRKAARKGYNYDINRKRLNKKRKKVPAIHCKQLKAAWDTHASVNQNFEAMGLAADPNKTIKIPKPKEILTAMEIDREQSASNQKTDNSKSHPRDYVVDELEAEANRPLLKTFSLPGQGLEYIKYMIDKYGEDYKAMAKDPRNHYQDTPKQLRQKAKRYNNSRSKYKNNLENKSDENPK